jgi:HK97 family phage portal protein
MGLLAFLRGDNIPESSTESRALPRPDNECPVVWPGITTVRSVNTGNVLAITDAYSCVRVLADSIATPPLKVYRRTDTGRIPAGDDQRLVQLLRRPSPGSTSVDPISQIVTHLNVFGECFLGKYKADREIVRLACINPESVRVELEGRTITYVLEERTRHGVDDILHVKGLSLDRVRGMSPVSQRRTALGLNEKPARVRQSVLQAGLDALRCASRAPRHAEGNIDRLYEDWRAKQEGLDNIHQIAVIEGDMDFKPVAFNASDSQFLESREFSTREVCRIFRVPRWAVDGSSGDSMTHANVSEQARALVTYSLRPWIVSIETAFTSDADLCPGSTYCQFDLDGLLRASPTDRAQVYTQALHPETGWMRRSEVRELEDLEPEPTPPPTQISMQPRGWRMQDKDRAPEQRTVDVDVEAIDTRARTLHGYAAVYTVYLWGPGQGAPNGPFGLQMRVWKQAATAILDATSFGRLYTSPVELRSFEADGGLTNRQNVRMELNAGYAVERSGAGLRIP